MRLRCAVALLAIIWVPTVEAQTLEEILARHVEALGGIDNLRAIRSIRMSGRVTAGGGREALVVREVSRPDRRLTKPSSAISPNDAKHGLDFGELGPGRLRTEFTYQGVTGVYVFDGEGGWKVSPFDGSLAPEPMPDEEALQTADQADIEGPLVDWQAKGHQVSLSGKENLGGRDVYRLDVTLRGGRELREYLDAQSLLLARTETTRLVRGHPLAIETSFDDYRAVGGIRFAHAIETGAVGRPQRLRIVVEQIEINPSLDDARFEMPPFQR